MEFRLTDLFVDWLTIWLKRGRGQTYGCNWDQVMTEIRGRAKKGLGKDWEESEDGTAK